MRMRLSAWMFSIFIFQSAQAAPTEIVFWHAMAGQLGSELQSLVQAFNQQQSDFVVKTLYKGDYVETLTSFVASFRAHVPPDIVQVFEVGNSMMMSVPGVIKPLHVLMKEQGVALPEADFFKPVVASYSVDGNLMAMPLNISVPAIFYQKDTLEKLGVTEQNFPKTWSELEVLAEKLKKAHFSCAYTTAYPAWILIESYSALHGLSMVQADNEKITHHLNRLLRWQKAHYFVYGGRTDDATILFTSGRCPLMSQSSGAFQALSSMVPFKIGIAPMPLDTEASQKRYANVVGGAALWAVSGRTPEVYRGIAAFFAYLSRPEVQLRWHQRTGYLPLGMDGHYQSIVQKDAEPSLKLAFSEWFGHDVSNGLGQRIAQNQVREINDEALESIFAGIKTPEEAMKDAVNRSNHAILRFLESRDSRNA